MRKEAITLLESYPRRFYSKGEFIAREGDAADYVFFLARGTCVRTCYSNQGHELSYEKRSADNTEMSLLGALSLYKDVKMYEANIVAETNCLCHIIPSSDFISFLDSNPSVMHGLLRIVVQGYSNLNINYRGKLRGQAPARIASYLLQETESTKAGFVIPHRFNAASVARNLGLHRVTVGKIIDAYVNEKVLLKQKSVIVVTEPRALQAYAQGTKKLDY